MARHRLYTPQQAVQAQRRSVGRLMLQRLRGLSHRRQLQKAPQIVLADG